MANDDALDRLTGLATRRRLVSVLDEVLASGQAMALALVDVDHFKHFNMHNGHMVGDAVLRGMARVIEAELGDGEEVFRVAGQQFVVTVPGAVSDAVARAEMLRVAVEASTPEQPEDCGDPHCLGPVRPLSVSIGVVAVATGLDSAGVMEAAQQAVERAKRAGRNRVAT